MGKIRYYLKRPVEKIASSWGRKKFWGRMGEYMNMSVINPTNLPLETSAIVVPNHEIGFDGIALCCGFAKYADRQAHFLVQSEGVYNGGFHFLLWATGQIPVNVETRKGNKKTIQRVQDYLHCSRDLVGIFSEGPTKNMIENGEMQSIEKRKHNSGAAHFSIKMKKPIVPIAIRTSESVRRNLAEFGPKQYDKKMDWVKQYTATHGKFSYIINVGLPVTGNNKIQLTEKVRQSILSLYKEAETYILA